MIKGKIMSSSPLLISAENSQHNHAVQHSERNDFQKSKIALFIDKSLIQEIKVHEGRIHLIARRAFQVTSVVADFGGRIPFIEMNLDLAGDNKMYGGALAYGTCAFFGYLVSYSLLEIHNPTTNKTERTSLLE